MVGEAFGEAEDRPLDEQGRDQLQDRDVAIAWLRRILVVDHGPDALEGLLGDDAGEEAGDDADRGEEDLHGAGYPGGSATNGVHLQ